MRCSADSASNTSWRNRLCGALHPYADMPATDAVCTLATLTLAMLVTLLLVLCAVGVYAGYCNHFNIGAFMEKVCLGVNL